MHLVGQILLATFLHWALIGSDDFNRADGTLISANWTLMGGGSPVIQSNQVTGGSFRVFFTGTYPNDQWSTITLAAQSGTSGGGPIVRASVANDSYVSFTSASLGAGSQVTIAKFNAGSFTSLTTATVTINAGDKMTLEVVGTTLNLYINYSLVATTTDGTISSGNPGFDEAATGVFIDDFNAGAVK